MSYRMEAGRRRTALEEAWLLRELVEVHGESPTTLAVSLHRSASWISRRLALVRVLPESVQSAVRRGQLPAQAAMKSLVPLARANRTQCEDLVTHLEGRAISVRQMESLYQGWKAGDAEQRARLTERPWLFLKAKDEVTSAPIEEPSEGARLVTMVETLVGLTCQVRRRIRLGAWDRTNEIQRRSFRGRCLELELVWAEIDQVTHEEKSHARSRHACRDHLSHETGPRDPRDRTDSGAVEEHGQTRSA